MLTAFFDYRLRIALTPLTSAISAFQIRKHKNNSGYGPYRNFRPNRITTGVVEPLLKYHINRVKYPWEKYGVQDQRDKQKQKGIAAAKLPIKVKLQKDVVYAWCACGYSWKQPFCDGTHNNVHVRTPLSPVRYIPDRDMEVWLCVCKQTNNKPFCDGSHKCAKFANEYTEDDIKDLRSKGHKL